MADGSEPEEAVKEELEEEEQRSYGCQQLVYQAKAPLGVDTRWSYLISRPDDHMSIAFL